MRAGALAKLGHADEAASTVSQALEYFPDLTIEGLVNDPGLSDNERQRFIETMGLAGFPACAKATDELRLAEPVRLPECVTDQQSQN